MPRVLPSAPEAEASLLGTMLVYPSSSRTALEEGLEADDFFIEANRRIYHACEELYQEGIQIDSTTVATRLKETDLLDKSGGMSATFIAKFKATAVLPIDGRAAKTIISPRCKP